MNVAHQRGPRTQADRIVLAVNAARTATDNGNAVALERVICRAAAQGPVELAVFLTLLASTGHPVLLGRMKNAPATEPMAVSAQAPCAEVFWRWGFPGGVAELSPEYTDMVAFLDDDHEAVKDAIRVLVHTQTEIGAAAVGDTQTLRRAGRARLRELLSWL